MTNPDEKNDGSTTAPATVPKVASPHDTLFYKIFSDPKLAAAELRSILPADVAAHIDWEFLRTEPHRFVDGNLGNHVADILLSAPVRQKKTYTHLLFEHSSGPKTNELLQALRYQVRIWENEKPQSNDDGARHLTPILTVILHHSETGWKSNRAPIRRVASRCRRLFPSCHFGRPRWDGSARAHRIDARRSAGKADRLGELRLEAFAGFVN